MPCAAKCSLSSILMAVRLLYIPPNGCTAARPESRSAGGATRHLLYYEHLPHSTQSFVAPPCRLGTPVQYRRTPLLQICRPPSTNGKWQHKILFLCQKLLHHCRNRNRTGEQAGNAEACHQSAANASARMVTGSS